MPDEIQIQLIDYIRVIQRKLRFILTGTAVILVIAVAYFWGYCKNVYEAKATLLNIAPRFQKFGTDVTSNALTMVSLQNLLESRDLLAAVREKMGWEKTVKLDDFIKQLEVKLLIEEDTNIRKSYSPIIELYAEANTGKDAAKLANLWAELFIERYNELTQTVSSQTYQFIESEYASTETQLKTSQAELSKLSEELMNTKQRLGSTRSLLSGYLVSPESGNVNLPQENMVEMLKQKEWAESNNQATMRVDNPSSTGLLESNHLIGYEGQLQDIELRIKELEAKEKAGESVKAELAGAIARKGELTKKTGELKRDITGLENEVSRVETKTAELERTVATLQSKFILLAKRKEEAEIEKAKLENTLQSGVAQSDDIKIASRAVPPEKKIGPKRLIGTVSAGIFGFILFTLLAFFQNYMDIAKSRISTSA